MADLKVYEVDATIMLRFCFEVDAKDKAGARDEGEKILKQHLATIKKEYDTADIDIEQVEESEGH